MDKFPFSRLFWVECVHPVNGCTWCRGYTKEVSLEKIYQDLIESGFILEKDRYVFSLDRSEPVTENLKISSDSCFAYRHLWLIETAPHEETPCVVADGWIPCDSEIAVKFISDFTRGVIEANVNSMLTGTEIIRALSEKISFPFGSKHYSLAVADGPLMDGKETLQDAGAINGCTVRIVLKDDIVSNEVVLPDSNSKICVYFTHPITDGKLVASISHAMTAKEIILALISENFISGPAELFGSSRYCLGTEDGEIGENDTLRAAGVKDGCLIRVVERCIDVFENIEEMNTTNLRTVDLEISVRFMHPTTGSVLDASISPSLTAEEIIDALIGEHFLVDPTVCGYDPHYVLALENNSLLNGTDTIADAGVVDGNLVRVLVAAPSPLDTMENKETPEVKNPPDSLDITVTFLHPYTNEKLEAEISRRITADDVVRALIRESFIHKANDWYRLAIEDNSPMDGACKLWNAGAAEGCSVRIIPVWGIESSNNSAQVPTEVPIIGSEIVVIFIHPTTSVEMKAQIDGLLTADQVLTKLIRMSFLEYIGAVRYSLKIGNGMPMRGTDTFHNAGVTDGCTIRIIQTSIEG